MGGQVTARSIIKWFQGRVEQKIQESPSRWCDAAQKLSVLLGDEQDRLARMEQSVAELKLSLLKSQEGARKNVSQADAEVRATDLYREMRQQEMFCERVIEFIRLAKMRARLASEESKNQH